jgi:broad specificity phosphatase PhoE
MTSVLWARHGENVANLTRTFSYRVFDGDLTILGQRQAHELADRLAHDGGAAVRYLACSPLRRAQQTADVVARRLGIPVAAELDGLRELNVGSLDGRRDDQAWDTYHQVLAAWQAGQVQARFPGGEDLTELHERLWQALRTVARECTSGRALIVAHGGNLRAALPTLTGEPDPGTDLRTGAVATLQVDPARRPPTAIQLLNWPAAD